MEQKSWSHTEVYRRLDTVENRIDNVEVRNAKFLEAIATLQQTIEHNGQAINQLKDSVDALRRDMSDHRTDIARGEQSGEEVTRRLSEAEGDIGALQHHVYRWGGFGAAVVLLINLFVALIAADVITV